MKEIQIEPDKSSTEKTEKSSSEEHRASIIQLRLLYML